MILELLADIFFGLIEFVINLLPTIDLDISIINGFSELGKWFGYIDTFIPLSAIVACISIVIVVDNASFFIKIFNFIIRKIPGIS